jgi:hypothetical protein
MAHTSLTLALNDEQTEALRRRAGKDGRTIEDVALAALDEYLLRTEDDVTEGVSDDSTERFSDVLRRLGE